MPVVTAEVVVPVEPEVAFAVSQTTGPVRLRWDRFIRRQHLLDDAAAPGRGVRTLTVHRAGLQMITEYVSYVPPRNVGMRMVRGPWFFASFAAGWRFEADGPGRTRVVWKYNFSCRPALVSPIAEFVGRALLGFEIRRRIRGFAAGCTLPEVANPPR